MIARARHVARHRIDRLDFAREALRRTRIEQPPVGALSTFGDFTGVEPQVAVRSCREVTGAAPVPQRKSRFARVSVWS
jgi:hypothetical protein